MMSNQERVSSSFRDPSGYLFKKNGILYRRVNLSYKQHYDKLISSGLFEKLVKEKKLVNHEEVSSDSGDETAYMLLRPSFVTFISYPYEWSFSQLKDAAILTLEIQEEALNHGLTLKDANGFNITFSECAPIFIDTLSFERYVEGRPWIAYGQFCRHFLSPLLLMKHCDERLIKLLNTNLDGIPLDIASKLLPKRTYLSIAILLHIHFHAMAVKKYGDANKKVEGGKMSLDGQRLLIRQLKNTIRSLKLNRKPDSVWKKYYQTKSYSDDQFEKKLSICRSFLTRYQPKLVWDLGCNTGQICALSASMKIPTIAVDNDHDSIEELYLNFRDKQFQIYPLYLDIVNQSPNCGWASAERSSLNDRGPAEMVFAMALVHHLVIANNILLLSVAEWFHLICSRYLAIEFVPKDDIQVTRLLLNREDIFEAYEENKFREAFSTYFEILETNPVLDSGRVIYLMQAK